MKIGFPVDNNHLDAQIAGRMSSTTWLMVVDTQDMSFKAVLCPPMSAGSGAGIQVITLLLEMGAQVLKVGYIAPHIAQSLENSGIKIITNVSGRVRDLVEPDEGSLGTETSEPKPLRVHAAFKKTLGQFLSMVPVLVGVILIMGLVQAFLTKAMILKVFSKNPLVDAVIGTFAGSLFAGNPINAYVIGQSMLELGAGWAGACALMMAWVSIGLVQMPAEAHAMGLRFALVRNAAGFVMTILASLLTLFFAGVW